MKIKENGEANSKEKVKYLNTPPPPFSGSFQGISLRGGSATDGMPLTILEYRSASRMFSFDLFLFM